MPTCQLSCGFLALNAGRYGGKQFTTTPKDAMRNRSGGSPTLSPQPWASILPVAGGKIFYKKKTPDSLKKKRFFWEDNSIFDVYWEKKNPSTERYHT
jgi:hypothetical protein